VAEPLGRPLLIPLPPDDPPSCVEVHAPMICVVECVGFVSECELKKKQKQKQGATETQSVNESGEKFDNSEEDKKEEETQSRRNCKEVRSLVGLLNQNFKKTNKNQKKKKKKKKKKNKIKKKKKG
jgi:hypothetical protein